MKDDIENNQEQKKELEFHWLVTSMLVLLTLSSLISSITKFISNLTWGQSSIGIFSFVLELANVIFVYFIIKKKAWGLFALFGLLLLQIPINLLLGCQDIEQIIISVIIRLAIFSIILLIPKNGKTAWFVLLSETHIPYSHKRNKGEYSNAQSNQQGNEITACPVAAQVDSSSQQVISPTVWIIYIIWGFIHFAILMISLFTTHFKFNPYIPNEGQILPDFYKSEIAFFPFSSPIPCDKYTGYFYSRSWDISCYDWTEFLFYMVLPLICIYTISLVIKHKSLTK